MRQPIMIDYLHVAKAITSCTDVVQVANSLPMIDNFGTKHHKIACKDFLQQDLRDLYNEAHDKLSLTDKPDNDEHTESNGGMPQP